jgi:hypothetical protein
MTKILLKKFLIFIGIVGLLVSCTDVLNPNTVLDFYKKANLKCTYDIKGMIVEVRYLPSIIIKANRLNDEYKKNTHEKHKWKKKWKNALKQDSLSYLQIKCSGNACEKIDYKNIHITIENNKYTSVGMLPVQIDKEQNKFEYMMLFNIDITELAVNENEPFKINIEKAACSLKIPKDLIKIIEDIRNEIK